MKKFPIAVLAFTTMLTSCNKYNLSEPLPLKSASEAIFKSSASIGLNSGAGIKSVVYILGRDTQWPFAGSTPVAATVSVNGEFVTEWPVYLPDGLFDFYSLSYNTDEVPFIDSYGVTTEVQNGKDYLWSGISPPLVNGNYSITFIYRHIATKIKLNLDCQIAGVTFTVNSISFTLPNATGTTLNLKTGVITPASSTLPLSVIPGTGSYREFFTIPCITAVSIEADVNLFTVNGSQENRKFSVQLNEHLTAGYSYIISLYLNPKNEGQVTVYKTELNNYFNNIPFEYKKGITKPNY